VAQALLERGAQADVVDFEGRGRYIQMMGVAGGSSYGYSLYEFAICSESGPSALRRGSGVGLAMGPDGQPLGMHGVDALGRRPAGTKAPTVRILPVTPRGN
jgi:hypothetical protein